MGRPRQFDVEQAVHTAAGLFWSKGFDGTSVQELTEAMDITPPSFYFAFGNKEALFRRAVEDYQQILARIAEQAVRQDSARAMVECLLTGFVDLFTDPAHAPGCLILNNALPIVDGHPFRRRFAEQREALRLQVQRVLEDRARTGRRGLKEGAAKVQSRLIVSLIWGFAVEAQSGVSRLDLRRAARAAAALWPS
ncbi:MAG: TetR/AcrR family transcriptional regulator [Nevskia sp.]|nr:TetR/AcrR family transcriptional regulator [Nevskia sp.]